MLLKQVMYRLFMNTTVARAFLRSLRLNFSYEKAYNKSIYNMKCIAQLQKKEILFDWLSAGFHSNKSVFLCE